MGGATTTAKSRGATTAARSWRGPRCARGRAGSSRGKRGNNSSKKLRRGIEIEVTVVTGSRVWCTGWEGIAVLFIFLLCFEAVFSALGGIFLLSLVSKSRTDRRVFSALFVLRGVPQFT